MRWVGFAIVVVIGVVGCRRVNPSFGDDGTDSTTHDASDSLPASNVTSQGETPPTEPTDSASNSGTSFTSNGPATLTDSQGGTMGPTDTVDPSVSASDSSLTTTGKDVSDETGNTGVEPPNCMPRGQCNPNFPQDSGCPGGEVCRPWGSAENPDFGCFALTFPTRKKNSECESFCTFGGNDSGCGEGMFCDTRGGESVCRALCGRENEPPLCGGAGSCVFQETDGGEFGSCFGECDPLEGNDNCEKGELCVADLDQTAPTCEDMTSMDPKCDLTGCPPYQLCIEGGCRAVCDTSGGCNEGTPCTPVLYEPPLESQLGYCPPGVEPEPIGMPTP